MTVTVPSQTRESTSVADLVAQKTLATPPMIWPFADRIDLLADLLRVYSQPGSRLVCPGPITPEIAIAADRAETDLVSLLPASPFAGQVDQVVEAVGAADDIVYLANPNRVTGATYSLSDLRRISRVGTVGLLVVDEHYFDYFGISALPLLDTGHDVVILRSSAASLGRDSSDAGYAIAQPRTIDLIRDTHSRPSLSLAVRQTIMAPLINDAALEARVREVHAESLRLGTRLHRLGIQSRLTATDFILIRVAKTKMVCRHLAAAGVAADNLEECPQLSNYIRYQILTAPANDIMLGEFENMPPDDYRLDTFDNRSVTFRLARELSERPSQGLSEDGDMPSPPILRRKPRLARTGEKAR